LRPLEISAFFSVEPMMYFGLGFLAAALIAIAIYPAVVNRSVRLTTRRVMAAMPASMNEALAGKDTVRAMFAVSVSKLEKKTEQLVARMAAQAGELSRQTTINRQLKQALDDKARLVAALEVREGAMMSRENLLIEELMVLRDQNRKNRESVSAKRLPPALSPWQ
jgi:hypothetical protein